jgi:hypothetical protein
MRGKERGRGFVDCFGQVGGGGGGGGAERKTSVGGGGAVAEAEASPYTGAMVMTGRMGGRWCGPGGSGNGRADGEAATGGRSGRRQHGPDGGGRGRGGGGVDSTASKKV